MKEAIEYLYLLDYSDYTICEIELTEKDENKNVEDILREHSCNADTCAFMFSKNRIEHIITI